MLLIQLWLLTTQCALQMSLLLLPAWGVLGRSGYPRQVLFFMMSHCGSVCPSGNHFFVATLLQMLQFTTSKDQNILVQLTPCTAGFLVFNTVVTIIIIITIKLGNFDIVSFIQWNLSLYFLCIIAVKYMETNRSLLWLNFHLWPGQWWC